MDPAERVKAMTSLLEIQNLLVVRDQRLVLEIDHLVIEKNKVVALIGPNGAGKSTLILVLAGLIHPKQGEIRYKGQQLDPYRNRDYRRQIGLVIQEPLLLDMSVFDNIAIGLLFRNTPKTETSQRVGEWLERLKIAHLRNRPALKLSGGEAQRVALARAMILKPELLLLDEPFSSLDKNARTDLIQDFKLLLPETGATVVFSTHDDREVALLAESKMELSNGRYNRELSMV
jgi:tungstate transport system ATP-binding protein